MKNRYGVADQVIPMTFYGAVGWFKEIEPAEKIPNHAQYFNPADNIPCKRSKINIETQDSEQKDSEVKDEDKQQITFSF